MQNRKKTGEITPDQMDSLRRVLLAIHGKPPHGKTEIAKMVGLGRAVVSERVNQLMDLGIVAHAGRGASTGGRPSVEVQINASAGFMLVADLGATGITVAITDLACTILESREEPADIAEGPNVILKRVVAIMDNLIVRYKAQEKIWGLGIGVPGPVEFATGLPSSPPIMPGWDQFPIRDYFQKRYDALTWVDNDVNLMALGEARDGVAVNSADTLFVKVGTGIGVGLISQGEPHRGAQGAAGDVGHIAITTDQSVICKCGNIGCLEAVAGGAAIARQGLQLAQSEKSAILAAVLKKEKTISAKDVAAAAQAGDADCLDLIVSAGRTIGTTLAGIVNFYNPDLLIIGGGVAQAGNQFLAAIRETIYRRSLPLATRDLQIVLPSLGSAAGVVGCAHMVIEQLFRLELFQDWIAEGSPVGLAS